MKKKFLIIALVSFLINACTHKIDYHGHNVDNDKIKEIRTNTTEKNSILELIGPPSIKNIYGEEIWYYVSYQNKVFGFMPPKIIHTKVLSITFNGDKVKDVVEFEIDENKKIIIDEASTSSYGTKSNIITHFTKNFRRFNQNGKSSISPRKPKGL